MVDTLEKIAELLDEENRQHGPDAARSLGEKLIRTAQLHMADAHLSSRIGKVKDTRATREYLGNISAQALNDRVVKHNILRLKSDSGRNGYPVFQFRDGRVHPRVQYVVKTLLDAGFSEWGVAYWLTEPINSEDSRAMISLIDDDEAYEFIARRADLDARDRKANS